MNDVIISAARSLYEELKARRIATKQEVPMIVVLFWAGREPKIFPVPINDPQLRRWFLHQLAKKAKAEFVFLISEAWMGALKPGEDVGSREEAEKAVEEERARRGPVSTWDNRQEVLMGWVDGYNEAVEFRSIIEDGVIGPTTETRVTKGGDIGFGGGLVWLASTNT